MTKRLCRNSNNKQMLHTLYYLSIYRRGIFDNFQVIIHEPVDKEDKGHNTDTLYKSVDECSSSKFENDRSNKPVTKNPTEDQSKQSENRGQDKSSNKGKGKNKRKSTVWFNKLWILII